eukprot:3304078-Alexandrium_andersonii.AAC.1
MKQAAAQVLLKVGDGVSVTTEQKIYWCTYALRAAISGSTNMADKAVRAFPRLSSLIGPDTTD